jgi:hypothetical protein
LFAEETIILVHSDSLVLQTLSFANLLQRSNLDSQYYWWIGGLFTCYFFFKTFVASMILGTEQRQENFADICCDSKIICVNKFTKKNYTFMESKNSPLGPSIKFAPRPLKSLSRPFLEQPRLWVLFSCSGRYWSKHLVLCLFVSLCDAKIWLDHVSAVKL